MDVYQSPEPAHILLGQHKRGLAKLGWCGWYEGTDRKQEGGVLGWGEQALGKSQDEDDARIWHLCQFLTPDPGTLRLFWVARTCDNCLDGTDPSSPIWAAATQYRVRQRISHVLGLCHFQPQPCI